MKLKSALILSTLLVGAVTSNAASVMVNNIANGPGDTLYANNNNSLMNGGLVTMGYFTAGILSTDIDTIPELVAQLGNFTLVTSAVPGTQNFTLGTSNPGYVDQELATSLGNISTGNPLLGRTLYSIVTSASSLGAATTSSQFALVAISLIKDDSPVPNDYTSNPTGLTPIIGTIGSFNGDAGPGSGAYSTLKMAAVPEPSAALLGAVGALGLLRRRRN